MKVITLLLLMCYLAMLCLVCLFGFYSLALQSLAILLVVTILTYIALKSTKSKKTIKPMPIDYSKYPPNWKQIRVRILERDGQKCKFCNVPNHEVIFRGHLIDEPLDIEIYQDDQGKVYDASNSKYLFENLFAPIAPLSGDPNQQAIKVVLTIAHLDHDEWNHDVQDDRLAALCQRCHLRYDAPEKARRRAMKKYKVSLFPMPNESITFKTN